MAANMIMRTAGILVLSAFVVINTEGTLEEDCSILMRLDSLETRLHEQEISLLKQDARISEQAVSLGEKDSRIDDIERKMAEKDTRIGELESSMTEKDTRIGELESSIEVLEESLGQQTTDIGELGTTLSEHDTELANLEQRLRPAQAVGFSARWPKAGIWPTRMAFARVITNEGRAFNASSGVFTCPVPGRYYFAVVLMKDPDHDGEIHCGIYKNDAWLVWAKASPGHTPQLGYYTAVNGVYTRLNVGDTVTVMGCNPIATGGFSHLSSFTGFMVTPDN